MTRMKASLMFLTELDAALERPTGRCWMTPWKIVAVWKRPTGWVGRYVRHRFAKTARGEADYLGSETKIQPVRVLNEQVTF